MAWNLAIHHIGVGQGDATLIVATETDLLGVLQRVRSALIDGGNTGCGALLYGYLTRHIPEATPGSRTVDVLVITHYDADHYRGIIELLRTPGASMFDHTQVFDQGQPPYDRDHFRYDIAKTRNPDTRRRVKASDFERYRWAIERVRGNAAGATIRRITRNVNSFYITHLTSDQKRDYVRPAAKHFTAPPLLHGIPVLEPDWLVRKEILWGDGVQAPGYASNPPAGAPTITCVAANKYVATGRESDTTTEFRSKVYRWCLADDGMSDRRSKKLESVLEYNERENCDSNGKSLAFVVRFGRFRYYLGGDLEATQEDTLARYLNPTDDDAGRVHAIKTSHHGANEATSDDFVERLRPLGAFISCGRTNNFDHPAPRVIEALEDNGEPYYVTELPYRTADENRHTKDGSKATGYLSASALAHGRMLPKSCDDTHHTCNPCCAVVPGAWEDGTLDPAPGWKHVRLTVSQAQASATTGPVFTVGYWYEIVRTVRQRRGPAVVQSLAKTVHHS